MWHTLEAVATSRKLCPESFAAFINYAHADKLDDKGMLSTWDIDELIKEYDNLLLPVGNVKCLPSS